MKKKLSWKNQHKEELKFFYKRIFNYYLELQSTEEFKKLSIEPLIIPREYTDFLFKYNLYHQILNAQNHHIIPRSLGGTDDQRNLIWLSKENHCEVHSILYAYNRKNASLRCAATMLKRNIIKYRYLTTPGDKRKYNNTILYGENSYQWNQD
jgi:hypothetical protein